MRRLLAFLLCAAGLLWADGTGAAWAQKHSFGTAPPTAPAPEPPPGPVTPVSSGLGAIQYYAANYAVPAPQALTRQLNAEDERARSGALSSLGAPGQYLARGHVPYPHAVQLDLAQLGTDGELDAIVTAELDQHLVSAILVPEDGGWRRVATFLFATSFSTGSPGISNFVRPLRSWLQPDRYRAVYHATVNAPSGDFTENEADVRVINGRAVVMVSFVSGARQCEASTAATNPVRPGHPTCELIQRWLEPDPADPMHHFTLITGIGHLAAHETDDPLLHSRNYRLTRLRFFACQPFVFSDASMHFEPTANSAPCEAHDGSGPHTEHSGKTGNGPLAF